MNEVLTIVIPVFALIAIGYVSGKTGVVSPQTAKGVADFTFTLAVPALLFRTMAVASLPPVPPYLVWAAYLLTVAAIWLAATLLTSLVLRRPEVDAPSIALSSAFGNVVMLGIPLALATYGPDAGGTIAMVLCVHTPVLMTVATFHMALAERSGGEGPLPLVRGLVLELVRNPIIMAVVAGSLWRLTGLGLHPAVDKILQLLGQAGVPSALVGLGLGLISFRIKGQAPTLATIMLLKIVAMPLIAWTLASQVFALPPVAVGVITLFALMPTGANAFLFATRYNRAVNSASGAVALGTVLSVITAAVLIYLLRG